MSKTKNDEAFNSIAASLLLNMLNEMSIVLKSEDANDSLVVLMYKSQHDICVSTLQDMKKAFENGMTYKEINKLENLFEVHEVLKGYL